MKIIQALGWYYPENLGGSEVYVSALAHRLSKLGHEVVVAAPLAGLTAPRTYSHDGLSVFRYPIPAEPTRDEAQGERPARGSEFFTRWLAELEPNIVHFHSLVTGLGLHEIRAASLVGAPVILTSHASSLGYICQRGTLMRWGEFVCDGLTEVVKCSGCELQHRGFPKPVARLLSREPVSISRFLGRSGTRAGTALGMPALIARNKRRQKELVAMVDKFVVLTGSAARIVEMNGIPDDKLAINPLGIIDTGLYQHGPPKNERTGARVRFGYLGRFDAVKGVFELAQALTRVPRSLGFSFEIRGPAQLPVEREILDQLREVVGDDPRVSFAPGVQREEVPGVLRSYDVLVCPSVCAEGGPTVALEAHAVGTPVIGSRIGGLTEIVEHDVSGMLVPAGDVDALAAMIESVATSPADTIDRWRSALRQPRTMDDVTKDYLELYNSVAVEVAPK
jgi:glycosyltransferase involved in cell wall biosynthesis